MIYILGNQLQEVDEIKKIENEEGILKPVTQQVLYIVKSNEVPALMQELDINYEGEIDLESVHFCKAEAQQSLMYCTLAIPKLLDVLGSRYRIIFFATRNQIIMIDDDGFAEKIIKRIRNKRQKQGGNRVKFLYNFFLEMINRDALVLEQYERELMTMEDQILDGDMHDYQSTLMPIRKQILTLRSYYDQVQDMCKVLEENENGIFPKKQLKYFGVVADRADRLLGKTIYLIDYAKQVQEAYQTQVNAIQNSNMQFLTMISTIFFPLTLITGWYGMNFQNMPELENGYPFIIMVSVVVVIVCIIIFRRKKLF